MSGQSPLMSGQPPLFSIITPVYNGARYLVDLLDSVQSQTFTNYEHIIIDDGSIDDGATIAILERYAGADPRIRWWTRENKGQYATQNEAIEAARGDYVLVISADDRFYDSTVFQIVADHLAQYSSHDVVYGKTAYADEFNRALPDMGISRPPSKWLIKQVVYAQHCSLFVRRAFVQSNNIWFDPTLHYTGDWDWLIRVFENADQIGYLKRFIACIRLHSKQTSRQATHHAVDAEHRLIGERYGGNYRLHLVITWLNNYRAMMLIAWSTLKTQGFGAMMRRIMKRLLPHKS